MKTLKLSLITAIILSISIGSLFAGGFALSGIGARAISMGGAFRGMADDATAMYWNPGGLGFMDNNCFSLAGAGILPTSEFTNSKLNSLMPAAANQPLEGFTFDKVSADKKLWMFPNLYAVKGGPSKLHYGLGVYVPYGLGASWDAFNLPTTMPTTTGVQNLAWSSGFPKNEMESSIGIVDIHPTVSYRMMDNLSLGLGVSVYYGMIEIKKIKPHSTYGYYLPTTMDLEGTGIGFGANIGALYKLNDRVSMGLTGKLPGSVKIKGDADIKAWLSDVMNYGMHANNPAYFTPYVASTNPDAEATVNLPGDIGWGISFKVKPNWTMNADFAYTMWSTLDKITIDLDPTTLLGQPVADPVMETNWKDTFRASLGTEYKFPKIALRAGFFFDQTPIPDGSLSPTWPDTADKYSANLGWGYNLTDKLIVDLSYEHIFFGEREIKNTTADSMAGTYQTDINAFNFGITYPF